VKSIRSILIISGLLLLFVGNVGVNVFKHICQENGVWTSYFVKTADDHCGDKHEAKKAIKSCCSSEKKEQKKDCCNDQTEFFKINLDFYNDPSISIPPTSAIIIPTNFVFVHNDIQQDYYTSKYVNPPPKRLGKDILIQYQVFLI
jgi:hypothetical protein